MNYEYCPNRFAYQRRRSQAVMVGPVQIGGDAPIVVQSMCVSPTQDIAATTAECIRLAEAGCQMIRITAPGKKDAQALRDIRRAFTKAGFTDIPLIADIHFTPVAALEAVEHVEKVRINPGNFADKKAFKVLEYTDESYQAELERVHQRFSPLVLRAKELGRAMRIGVNHGSLSDRIMNRYGDSPTGMVASAMEFIHIAEDHGYRDLIISMKSSNPKVMVHAYRLLTAELDRHGHAYPLHLGVTEAGDGEDGRIKGAAGIGALLEDGIGDTIRVSLTEAPEAEIPVARALADRYDAFPYEGSFAQQDEAIDFYSFTRRQSHVAGHKLLGGDLPVQVWLPPRIGHSDDPKLEGDRLVKWQASSAAISQRAQSTYTDMIEPFIYRGEDTIPLSAAVILIDAEQADDVDQLIAKAVELSTTEQALGFYHTGTVAPTYAYRRLALLDHKQHSICLALPQETNYITAACVVGGLLIDGIGDALFLPTITAPCRQSFAILQAVKARISKADFVACPSCGRTLFDLMEVTDHIRAATKHLTGVSIAIMGCIVNGPGEMADADFGYVGSGPGKITLYRGKTPVKKNIPFSQARDALIELIKEHNMWREPEAVS